LSVGADSYKVQRSLDNVTYTDLVTISGSPLATEYLDTTVSLNQQYWYKVSALQGTDQSSYTLPQSVIPTPTGEMTLAGVRLASQQRADRVNSKFVTQAEWRTYINQAMFELYDLLVAADPDMYTTTPITFTTDGSTYLQPLPNGANTFTNAITNTTFTPQPFYKLMGVDLNIQNANNGYVTINKFNFQDRNRFIYPNSASTIYGVFNLQYRLVGGNDGTYTIEFIPTPTANQTIRIWYVPRLKELLLETDTTNVGISGWMEYVIVRAAKYALDKEEADTSKLDAQILFLKQRIEDMANNRDVGLPDTISDSRRNSYNGTGSGWNGGLGGF
jgi:hypothetical protein